MSIKERQDRTRQALRRAILDAARELFLKDGYRNVSIRKIAERIEYSPAAIYSYFDSKDAIFFALAEEGFRLMASAVSAARDGASDPMDALRRGYWAYYQFSKTHPEYFELMMLDRSVPSLGPEWPRFQPYVIDMTAGAEAAIRAGIAAGMFAPTLDPAAAQHLLWAAAHGPAALGLCKRLAPDEEPDALARDLVEATLTGLQAGVHPTFVACCAHASEAHNLQPNGSRGSETRHDQTS